MNLTKRQQALLIGTILGDGYLQKTGERNARLRLEHGGKQKEYLLWKAQQFTRFFSGAPEEIARFHPGTKKTYTYWRWQSHASPELGKWRTRFYMNGVKHIPETLGKLLRDPLSLAVWYMDDGYYSQEQKHSFIYLGRVSRTEADIAQKTIADNFGIVSRVYDKKEKGFALFFSVVETKKFHALVREHIVPSMAYKLSLTP